MKLIALAALALMIPQESNEAETLFKKMEEKIVKAKTLRVKPAGVLEERKFQIAGELLLDEGAKARIVIEGKGEEDGKAVVRTATVTCDGSKTRFQSNEPGENRDYDAPESFGKLMRTSFARAGFLSSVEFADGVNKAKTEPDAAYAVSGFKMGDKEKVGERDAQAVKHTVTRKGREVSATVWIDLETHLPLKRVLKMDRTTLTENYPDLKLDEKIEDAKFELPK